MLSANITVAEIREVVQEIVQRELAPLRTGVALALYTALDPWEYIHSVETNVAMTRVVSLLTIISTYYAIPKQHYCMFLGQATHCDIISSHLWPLHTAGEGLQMMGLVQTDINEPRNFLRLHKVLEKAFDHKRIILEHHEIADGKFKLKLHAFDPSFLTEEIIFNNQPAILGCSIDGTLSDYSFSSSQKPFLRVLAVHAQKSLSNAKQMGWAADERSGVSFRQRAMELARLSLEPQQVAMLFPAL
jgi:hypothetical protein